MAKLPERLSLAEIRALPGGKELIEKLIQKREDEERLQPPQITSLDLEAAGRYLGYLGGDLSQYRGNAPRHKADMGKFLKVARRMFITYGGARQYMLNYMAQITVGTKKVETHHSAPTDAIKVRCPECLAEGKTKMWPLGRSINHHRTVMHGAKVKFEETSHYKREMEYIKAHPRTNDDNGQPMVAERVEA